jgi:penicillin amidase
MEQITVEDMKGLQYDSYNLQAAESLPVMLNLLASYGESSKEAQKYLTDLKSWDFFADPAKKGQTLYSIWFAETSESIWRELMEQGAPVVRPNNYQTIALMSASPEDTIFDVHMAVKNMDSLHGRLTRGGFPPPCASP